MCGTAVSELGCRHLVMFFNHTAPYVELPDQGPTQSSVLEAQSLHLGSLVLAFFSLIEIRIMKEHGI